MLNIAIYEWEEVSSNTPLLIWNTGTTRNRTHVMLMLCPNIERTEAHFHWELAVWVSCWAYRLQLTSI